MPYTKQLNLMIEKSGKSLKEIAYECKNYGVEITQSYIGILRNSIENKIPSEPVSRALAQVCGEKYIDLLVVEGGIDKCPEIIREKFEIMRSCYKKLLLKIGIPVENLPSDESINNIPYYKILDITVNSLSNNIDLIEDKETENLLIQETEYQVFDDNLEPEIKKGQKFKLLCIKLNRYQENDILYYREKGKLKCKKVRLFSNNNFILQDKNGLIEVRLEEIEPLGIIDQSTLK